MLFHCPQFYFRCMVGTQYEHAPNFLCCAYEELLSHNNCFSIHDQNMPSLATEIYKVADDLSVRDFKNLFHFKYLNISLVSNELKGKNSIRYFGVVIWHAVLINIKTDTSLNGFKSRIKSWSLKILNVCADSAKAF